MPLIVIDNGARIIDGYDTKAIIRALKERGIRTKKDGPP